LVIARDMQRAGAGIRSLAEPFLDTTRADAKEKGVKFGRKPTLTPHQQKEASARLAAGETQRSVARSYNVSQSTISRL
jgi:DNA invertase Pin-like site-specific DNA recombinase